MNQSDGMAIYAMSRFHSGREFNEFSGPMFRMLAFGVAILILSTVAITNGYNRHGNGAGYVTVEPQSSAVLLGGNAAEDTITAANGDIAAIMRDDPAAIEGIIGKTYTISGFIAWTEATSYGTFVYLDTTANEFAPEYTCFVPKAETIASLEPGTALTLSGTCQGLTQGSLNFSDCVVK